MQTPGIYKIQSILHPKRCYIGSAVNLAKRWTNHLSDLRKKKHGNPRLQNHFNKYGISDLQFTVLLGCDKEDLLKTEQYFIDSYNPYFNIVKIAGSNLGRKFDETARKNMSIAHQGQKAWGKGKKYSAEHCKNLSISHKGKKLSDITKQRMSASRMGQQHSIGVKQTKKAIANRVASFNKTIALRKLNQLGSITNN